MKFPAALESISAKPDVDQEEPAPSWLMNVQEPDILDNEQLCVGCYPVEAQSSFPALFMFRDCQFGLNYLHALHGLPQEGRES